MSVSLLTRSCVAVVTLVTCSTATHLSWAQTRVLERADVGRTNLVATSNSGFFTNPPSLDRVSTVSPSTYPHGIYQFTITVPSDAGSPLKAVRITQDRGLEAFEINRKGIKVFTGNRYTTETAIPLASVGGVTDEPAGEVTIAFAQPVQPGSSVTIHLTADHMRHLLFSGVYNFSVTAYPEGGNSQGQMIGVGRINVYRTRH